MNTDSMPAQANTLQITATPRPGQAQVRHQVWPFGFALLWATAVIVGAGGVLLASHLEIGLPTQFMRAGAVAPAAIIEPEEAVSLVRRSLLRLDDAIRTGNYAVFRATASPAFQTNNSEQDLATIFSWVRDSNMSLAAASDLRSSALQPAALEQDRHLMLRGVLADSDQTLNFDLLYEPESDGWCLFGVAIYRD